MSLPDMHQAALWYAQSQYAIFPVHGIVDGRCTCGGLHADSPKNIGKHPATSRGFQDASRDGEQINDWWRQNPAYNIGLATGRVNGLFVVDIEESGLGDLGRLVAEHGTLPPTYTVRSGGGGLHLYFQYPPEAPIRNKTKLSGLPIDCRGDGGYIIAPPSAHVRGGCYASESSQPIAPAPDWILELVTQSGRFAPERTSPTVAAERHSPATRVSGETAAPDIIERARRYLARIPGAVSGEGGHNATITVALHLVRDFGLSPAAAYPLLDEWNQTCQPSWSESDLHHKLAEADREDRGWRPRGRFLVRPDFHMTDLGNAERLVAQHGEDLRYCRLWGEWFVWDGTRWRRDNNLEIMRRAKLSIRSMYDQAARMTDDGARQALVRHAANSEKKERLMSMVKLAESETEVAITPDAFDQQPWLLNVSNGTVDLLTGLLRAHDRADVLTQMTPIVFDPQARCPSWLQSLNTIFSNDADLLEFVQRYIGYCLTGDVREQFFVVGWGTGSNGKSIFLEILRSLLGDYAFKGSQDLLVSNGGDSHPTGRMDLFGKRLCICSETEDGQRLRESLIKDLTGGERIRGRRMREDNWEYSPTHKLFLATNHKPVVKGNDHAIWRRLLLLPFNNCFWDPERDRPGPEHLQADKTLVGRLKHELPGILNWAIQGCLAWQSHGLGIPQVVLDASTAYRKEQDVLGRFIDEQLIVNANMIVRSKAIYNNYRDWAEDNGHCPMSQTKFSPALAERGFAKSRDSRGAFFEGVMLRHDNPHAPRNEPRREDALPLATLQAS